MSIDVNHTTGKITTANKNLKLQAINSDGTDYNVSAEMNRVVNVNDPIDAQDAVTKRYLEEQIAGLTSITNLLAPPAPDLLNDYTIAINNTNAYRITNFIQTDNTNTGLTASPGQTVSRVLRTSSYTTNTLTEVGPGNTGIAQSYLNNSASNSSSANFGENYPVNGYTFGLGKTQKLQISNNVDYGTITGDPLGFNFVYSVAASGSSAPAGWNNVKISHDSAETNTATWYYDASNPGIPEITNISVTPDTNEQIVYSSSVPHYTSSQLFNIQFEVNKLSGDFYPSSDNFFDASTYVPSGSGIRAMSDISYATANITTPLPRNYLVDSGTVPVTTTAFVANGTGISTPNTGPSATIDNSYNTATVNFTVPERIIYMHDDVTSGEPVDETKIIVQNVGYGNGNGYRVVTVDSDTPAESATYTAWTGQTTALNSFDATVVGGNVTHDTTNYSTGYLPVGPDLSIGRAAPQYINFAFERTATSKFKITYSGRVHGAWIRLPGSAIDSTSTENGWMDATIPYEGIGIPGANTSAGGNGSNGCGLSSVFTTSSVTGANVNVTFGTESSSNATDNVIIVRFKLEAGDTIDNIKFVRAD